MGISISAEAVTGGKAHECQIPLVYEWFEAMICDGRKGRPQLTGKQIENACSRLFPSKDAAMRILLVEDHEDTRNILQRLLARKHEVLTASSIAEARPHCDDCSFDLAIVDIGLPDGDGYDLIEHITKCGVKAIALSGYGMPEDLVRSQAAGFIKHILKPISMGILEEAIAELSN
jgi:CheY-like chemotaxis protein